MNEKHTFLFIDGSHYDRLRSVLNTPLDLRKLADLAANGNKIDRAIYYRDRRDEAEHERLKRLFGWLQRNDFIVKGRKHELDEPRERYGTNLVEIAVDALELSQGGDQVYLIAADHKLLPLCKSLRARGAKVTLISTTDAPATIAPPDVLLDAVDDFIELADIVEEVAAAPARDDGPRT